MVTHFQSLSCENIFREAPTGGSSFSGNCLEKVMAINFTILFNDGVHDGDHVHGGDHDAHGDDDRDDGRGDDHGGDHDVRGDRDDGHGDHGDDALLLQHLG
ncbi:hypothetical protein CEXT_344801 [Caerostris extrusa]|uniref:Uncharacterized protein n=1 Tax=Caerostris extrusa TaxID=172846 RepID=A0AAV4P1R5_CAEEX|nr:hypothetical protein CEXT_344801 [Caerostris extrusa]